jgi:hypothetical protein
MVFANTVQRKRCDYMCLAISRRKLVCEDEKPEGNFHSRRYRAASIRMAWQPCEFACFLFGDNIDRARGRAYLGSSRSNLCTIIRHIELIWTPKMDPVRVLDLRDGQASIKTMVKAIPTSADASASTDR